MRQSDCTIEKPMYLVDWAVLFNRGSRRETENKVSSLNPCFRQLYQSPHLFASPGGP